MTEDEKDLIVEFILGKVIQSEFLSRYPIDVTRDSSHMLHEIIDAREKKDATQLECAFLLWFRFGLGKLNSNLLCQLMEEDWHKQHENIALLLKEFKDPSTVDCLYRAALVRLAYLDYDEGRALAAKAISALGAIGTVEAKEKLEILATSDNLSVSRNANRQLLRLSRA